MEHIYPPQRAAESICKKVYHHVLKALILKHDGYRLKWLPLSYGAVECCFIGSATLSGSDEMYLNKDLETISHNDLEKLQLDRMKKTLAAAMQTPFYKTRYTELKINCDKITSLQHLRDLPFTTKNDLRLSYPDGMLAVHRDEVVRIHASSGTTGKSTVIFYTKKDIDEWSTQVTRGMYSAGMRASDVFQNMMGYGLFTGGLGLHYGAEQLGCMIIPSATGNSHKQIELMQDFNATIMHITPSYALHLAELVQKELNIDPLDLSVKKAILGAEPYSEETRDKIEAIWGVDAYNNYGLSEMNGPGVAFECSCKTGMHCAEDYYIAEIIDPETLEPLPEGELGELILTHINRDAMPIIRYRTRDLTRFVPGQCECGRTMRRLDRMKGRTDDMLIISGVNVFPSQIEGVLMAIPEVGNNYQIVVDREQNLDRIHVRVELYSKMFTGDVKELEHLKTNITNKLKSVIIVTPRVEFCEQGSLPASTGKAVRVIDNRKI
jgi:phenylacetate-CoA ligase